MITQDGVVEDILLTDTDIKNGIEIEGFIVSNIKTKHDEFLKNQI